MKTAPDETNEITGWVFDIQRFSQLADYLDFDALTRKYDREFREKVDHLCYSRCPLEEDR